MSSPDILDEIKAGLGITVSDHDAWLQQSIDAIWARMERYTDRTLAAPPATFVDDWSRIVATNIVDPMPPLWRPQRASVFLRQFPVVTIEAVEIDGSSADKALVRFDPKTGKLMALTSSGIEDLSQRLYQSNTRVTYKAGWATVPPDLYYVVLGAMQPLWAAKNGAGMAGAPGTISSINVVDVGTVELQSGNAFVQAATGSASDPLIGPYTSFLEHFVDHRSRIGTAMQQVSEEVIAPP